MSSLLLRMCILNYPVWTCPENSHEHHFLWWFLFCGRLVSLFLWSLWSQNKVQLLTSVLAELLMISAIVWITRFPSFSSAIHNSFSCHTVILSYCHTVLVELLMISAIVWITRFPSFSSAIHNSFSCHTETGLTCACVNLPVFGDFFFLYVLRPWCIKIPKTQNKSGRASCRTQRSNDRSEQVFF